MADEEAISPTDQSAPLEFPITPGTQDGLETDAQPTATDDELSQQSSNFSDTPVAAAKGARDGADLLRRLSLVDKPSVETLRADPRAQFPSLELTGNIISATICVPFEISHGVGGTWELQSRHGTSALFDSFAYLSSEKSSWNHTLVGWTGEIQPALPAPLASKQAETEIPILAPKSDGQQAQSNRIQLPPDETNFGPAFNPQNEVLVVSADARSRLEDKLENHPSGKTIPVWLGDLGHNDTNLYLKDQSRWRRYAEHELYTLFHYRQHAPDDGRAERKSWDDYVRVNLAFADRILSIYQPGDIIWIHDYHLMLLPSLLRQRVPNAYIGFFLHIPFPSSEFMRCLPRRSEVLSGALGATMVGFQAFGFARHFNSCCKRILALDATSAGVESYGAHISVEVFPIGIDTTAVQKHAFSDADIDENIRALQSTYAGRKIIVGRDRLDTVRGVAQKLMAFERFLEKYEDWREKVVLIQVTSPTSVEAEKDDPAHKIESRISGLVSRINSKFGGLSRRVVEHYEKYLSAKEYFALLRAADVALITSVRDGMNTTSLEYVICQRDKHGPLILSEFSGTAASLGNAMHINPWDLTGVANMLNEALEMPEDQKRNNHEKLYEYVTNHTVTHWTDRFLTRLLTNLTSFSQADLTPLLDVELLKKSYHAGSKRLFMFDYDGTLTPIVKDPNAAIPTDKVFRTLKALAQDEKNEVWIISGRDEKFLGAWLGTIPELGLSAEHGCFMRPPGIKDWENLTTQLDMSWQEEVMAVFERYTERTPGAWVEKKRVALTWHYRQADPDWGAFQAKECRKEMEETVGKKWDVEVMAGKANLEVRPTFVNKGSIANRLAHERGYGTETPPDFIFCAGDDQTDEDMFKALSKLDLPSDHVFTCTVGASSKKTAARWHLVGPENVLKAAGELPKPYVPRKDDDPNTKVSGEAAPRSTADST